MPPPKHPVKKKQSLPPDTFPGLKTIRTAFATGTTVLSRLSSWISEEGNGKWKVKGKGTGRRGRKGRISGGKRKGKGAGRTWKKGRGNGGVVPQKIALDPLVGVIYRHHC